MPFHVEVSTGHKHARVFNVDEAGLWANVLERWVAGAPLELGEREWDPRESRLTILEGPRMEGPDLSFGQGWSNAQRASEEVTRQLLAAAEAGARTVTAGVLAADSLEAALRAVRNGQDPVPVRWADAVERIDGRDPEVTAVILVVRPPAPDPPQSRG
jgi:hypothetical protein